MWEVGRVGGMEGGRRRREKRREVTREVIVTSSNFQSVVYSIHHQGKLGNESTTKWDIPVLRFTTLLLRDIADGGMIMAQAVWVLPLSMARSKVCTRT